MTCIDDKQCHYGLFYRLAHSLNNSFQQPNFKVDFKTNNV